MGMSLDDPIVLATRELLAPVGRPRLQRMFGGVGLWVDEVFVGVIHDGSVFLRVGDGNRTRFDAVDAAHFDPMGQGKPMAYRELPEELLDSPERARPWIESSLAEARAAAARKPARRCKSSKPASLTSVRNLGPASRRMLQDAGIGDRAALERAGAARAFLAVEEAGHAPTLNLLWAIESGLADLPIGSLPDEIKRQLRRAVGRE
ncbi:TfoX/Sxy family protein [Engelhardtia mirabilis]|uniref:TfoX N-terminal domain-containing protein n=1 Tax=Engelhardtia mirabilis TaxID=2528011 RepID=A0A518BIF4_9BACT|nr:hypothetical protein Pla133_18350 [Planctomycetes bacterium Pla133]QDV01085.1 hypothetical protein Pla86_18340 [Planctomycetes bacterium Pla86]